MHRIIGLTAAAGFLAVTCVSLAFAGFIAGGGNTEADCYAGVDVTGVSSNDPKLVECTEGDACDLSGCGDGKCTFQVAVCVNETGLAGCTPPSGGLKSVQAAGPLKSTRPSTLTVAACGTPATFDLKLKGKGTKQKANKRILRMKATAVAGTTPLKDQDSFKFVCKPRTTPCSPSGAFVE
jgi:hypothetical protein